MLGVSVRVGVALGGRGVNEGVSVHVAGRVGRDGPAGNGVVVATVSGGAMVELAGTVGDIPGVHAATNPLTTTKKARVIHQWTLAALLSGSITPVRPGGAQCLSAAPGYWFGDGRR